MDPLKEAKIIELNALKNTTDYLSGAYKSRFKGRGLSFSEIRKYSYGDDVRSIDWNVTARHREPYIKLLEEERQMDMILLLDMSNSNLLGDKGQSMNYYMATIAASLGLSALRNSDKVAAVYFANGIVDYIPPFKSKAFIRKIIVNILSPLSIQKSSDISESLEFIKKTHRKKSLIFILSDFLFSINPKTIKALSSKHQVYAIALNNKLDFNFPSFGFLPLKDAENDSYSWTNTSGLFSKLLKDQVEYYHQQLEDCFTKQGAKTIYLTNGDNFAAKIAQAMYQ